MRHAAPLFCVEPEGAGFTGWRPFVGLRTQSSCPRPEESVSSATATSELRRRELRRKVQEQRPVGFLLALQSLLDIKVAINNIPRTR